MIGRNLPRDAPNENPQDPTTKNDPTTFIATKNEAAQQPQEEQEGEEGEDATSTAPCGRVVQHSKQHRSLQRAQAKNACTSGYDTAV